VSAPTVAVPTPDIAQWLASAKTAVKTCVVILAVIGAADLTEPLRADAAVVQPAEVKPKAVEGK
jgi:hypothetical protein